MIIGKDSKTKFASKTIKVSIATIALCTMMVGPVQAGVVSYSDNYNEYKYENVIKNSQDFDYVIDENLKIEQEALDMVQESARAREAEQRTQELRKQAELDAINRKKEEERLRIEEEAKAKLIAHIEDGLDNGENIPEHLRARQAVGETTIANDMKLIINELALVKGELSPRQIEMAKQLPSYLGKSYVWGANGPSSYDCSGFTKAMYAHVGTVTPRTASDQYTLAENKIPVGELQFGDLVFFKNTGSRRGITHVGMYVGNGLMVHASSTYNSIRTESVFSGYFEGKYVGAARY